MLKIDFAPPNTLEWTAWRERCDQATLELINQHETNGEIDFRDNLYKALKKEIYMNRTGPFSGKCVYCEQKIEGDQHGDIEHFRPKARVTDENDQPVMIEHEGERKPHPGYYWLAYEWTNLVPSCVRCNQASIGDTGNKIGKRNRFPVQGEYALAPGQENDEEPLLLNPLFDDPNQHMRLIRDTGVLEPVTERGRTCIEIFGLNDRGLPADRADKFDDIKNACCILVSKLAGGVDANKELFRLANVLKGSDEFSLAGQAAISEVDGPFFGAIEQNVQDINN